MHTAVNQSLDKLIFCPSPNEDLLWIAGNYYRQLKANLLFSS